MKRRMEEDRRPIVNIEALREYCEANSLQMHNMRCVTERDEMYAMT